MNHTKTTLHVWGEKKRETLSITDGQGDVCPVPCALCPAPSALSLSARGKCLTWVLKGRNSQKEGLGHGQNLPLFPSGVDALTSPWLGFLCCKMEAATELSLIRCSVDAENQLYPS